MNQQEMHLRQEQHHLRKAMYMLLGILLINQKFETKMILKS
ncbi:hypothetical protein CHCC20333_3534 [Bacillus paralicheniformis]|nr:hypothetical protein CHCC20333_3534 [Bacillus paralicheniformis]